MRVPRVLAALGFLVSTILPLSAEASPGKPVALGGEHDYTVTTIPAIAFFPATNNESYFTSESLGRNGPTNTRMSFYAPVLLPSGIVIDYIGLNSLTSAPAAVGVALYSRFPSGDAIVMTALNSTVHASWGTDYNASPLDRVWAALPGVGLMLEVEQGVFPTEQYFGSVEIWWRRVTNLAAGAPTFLDVPEDHPFFFFIEAIYESGITAGCGGGNFCPNAPLTRGQMAVFLTKALGLYWPAPTSP